jgi:hypothetical protein
VKEHLDTSKGGAASITSSSFQPHYKYHWRWGIGVCLEVLLLFSLVALVPASAILILMGVIAAYAFSLVGGVQRIWCLNFLEAWSSVNQSPRGLLDHAQVSVLR